MGAYSRWAPIRGWVLIKFSTFSVSVVYVFCTEHHYTTQTWNPQSSDSSGWQEAAAFDAADAVAPASTSCRSTQQTHPCCYENFYLHCNTRSNLGPFTLLIRTPLIWPCYFQTLTQNTKQITRQTQQPPPELQPAKVPDVRAMLCEARP